jgi:small-conductance mechanosensitive channel
MPFVLQVLTAVLALMLGGSLPVLGQGGAQASQAGHDAESEVTLAPVVIDGETLFSVRGVTALPAARRARGIEARIRELARNPRIGQQSLALRDGQSATSILADGQRIMAVLEEDAAVEQVTRQPLAQLYLSRIWAAIQAYRQDRSPGVLWWHAGYAFIATIVLLVAAGLGRYVVAFLRRAFERRYRARIQALESHPLHIVKVEQVWRALTGLLNLAWVLAIAFMVYAYLNYVLALFPWTRGLARSLFAIAMNPLQTLGLGLLGMIPNLVFLAVLVLAVRFGLRLMRILFEGLATGAVALSGFEPEWAWPTYRLVRLLVITLALVVAYPYIPGSGSDAFKGISVFLGIIFSLGSSSLIGNFIAGYSMTYRRAFRVGDRVKIGSQTGDVERMRLLVTHLRTPKNEEIIVPNSIILGSEVMNYSSMARDRGLILHTTVGIGYETPWRQVEAMLREAAARTPGLLQEPPPFVLKKALGDFCVTYELNVFCDTPNSMERLYTALHGHILDVFNEYQIQIMTPAYESDPVQPKVVPKDQWYAAPATAPQSAATAR